MTPTLLDNSKQALKELAGWYENVSLKTLKSAWTGTGFLDGLQTLKELIGFSTSNCTVCKTVKYNCSYCIWSTFTDFNSSVYCIQNKTYDNLKYAESPEELLTACRNRAKYIKELLEKNETR